MGSLIGHIVPGTFFGLFAMWWTFDFLRVYFRSRLSGKPYRSNPRFADPHRRTVSAAGGRATTLTGRLPPFEVVFKFVSIIIGRWATLYSLFLLLKRGGNLTLPGILGEYFTGLDENWNFVQVHHGQHMTMFAFFWFASVFELMYFYGAPVPPSALPPHLDLAAGALAFAVEGVLFLWHLDGRNKLDVQVHTFLVYSIALCTLAMTLEIFVRDDIRVHLFRCFSVWLQGAWFYAVGFILYPPAGWRQWDPESHHHGMMVTMLFTWHAAGVMGSMMLLAGLVYRSVRRDLLRTKQRICEDCRDDDFHEVDHRNAADQPTIPNGHVIKGGTSGNGYTRLPQSEDGTASVNLLLHHDVEDED